MIGPQRGDRVEDLSPRPQRRYRLMVGAAAPRDGFRTGGRQLLEQPGLAHAGFAVDQDESRPPGLGFGHGAPQGPEVALPPHEEGRLRR